MRGLAEYMIRHGKDAYVIPRNTLSKEIPYVPYIYTAGEIAELIAACDELAGGPAGGGMRLLLPCAVRLLYATGMRHGEARRLRRSGVDLGGLCITVGPSKAANGRLVYISEELAESMAAFDASAEASAPGREYFFSRADGGLRSSAWLQGGFQAAKCLAGIDEPGVSKRVHDIRNTYLLETPTIS